MDIISDTNVYLWQQPVWQHLQHRYPHLGHALLFYGKKGCGKHEFVQHFVAWLLCHHQQVDGACGQCQSCIWLKSGTHPHLMMIQPDDDKDNSKNEKNKKSKNATIKIDKIREILPFVQQTMEGWRVVVIDPAEALNISANNALLKTLEEPSERVIIILLAEHYLKLPATIRSRTQHFALDRISPHQAQHTLTGLMQQHQLNLSAEQQQVVLNLAEDMPFYALTLAQSEWLTQRHIFIQDWLKLLKNKDMPMFYATKWQKMMNFNEFNDMLEVIICDIIRIKLQQSLYNIDLDLRELAEQFNLQQLFSLYQCVQESKHALAQNVQTQLLLDDYVMRMMCR